MSQKGWDRGTIRLGVIFCNQLEHFDNSLSYMSGYINSILKRQSLSEVKMGRWSLLCRKTTSKTMEQIQINFHVITKNIQQSPLDST